MKKFVKTVTTGLFVLSAAGALCLCVRHTVMRSRRPLLVDVSVASLPQKVCKARLVFAGDLMMHTPQITAARRADGFDFDTSFCWIRERFLAADAVIVNLETTLADGAPYTGYPRFRSPAALAASLVRAGVDMVVLANNHCCDGGERGVATTLRVLREQGIEYTGVFRDSLDFEMRHPLYFEAGGIRFALLNYTYGTNGLPLPAGRRVNLTDTVRMATELASIDRRNTDCIIACMHWGNEYERRPNATQRKLADFLRRRGVGLVVGSHPHVVQPYVQDSAGVVIYSLGNFVSNQRKRYCDGGLVAEIEVSKVGDGPLCYAVEPIPVWVQTPGYRIVPPEVGDTLSMSAEDRVRYDRFLNDTRLLLGTGFGDD